MIKICAHCKKEFTPYHTVPDQKYCSNKICQKARKKLWQNRAIATIPAYQENQLQAQAEWRRRNPDYSKKYREKNPDYVEKNRKKQKIRNHKRRLFQNDTNRKIAKMDEYTPLVVCNLTLQSQSFP